MLSKHEVSRLFVLLYFVGVVLLASAFFILVPEAQRTSTAWLDLAVVIAVFSINFPLLSLGRMRRSSFNDRIPALGLLGLCDLIYSGLAIGFLICGPRAMVPFRLQLVVQLLLMFVAVAVVGTSLMATAHGGEVAEEEDAMRNGLDELKAALARCEAEIRALPPGNARILDLLHKLKEDARYLSPSREASARNCETDLVAQLKEICQQAGATEVPLVATNLDSWIEQCVELMELRKQVHSHSTKE